MSEQDTATGQLRVDPQARANALKQFTDWIADGKSFIAIYENRDKNSPDVGRRIGLQHDMTLYQDCKLGVTPATDSPQVYGAGWRYLAVGKFTDPFQALACLTARREGARQ